MTTFTRPGQCPHQCRVTRDKQRQSEASALVFHLPNLHWEAYNYPEARNPGVPWVLMTYESANSVRERAGNWGRFPAIGPGKHFRNVFNRTLTLRRDSDIVARHGQVIKRETPLTREEEKQRYGLASSLDWSNYTKGDNKCF